MSFSMRRLVICAALGMFALAGGCTSTTLEPASAAGWRGRAPNSADAFRFVILSDRTGGHVPGLYEKAVAEVNLLNPDFVMSVGDYIEGYSPDEQVLTKEWQEFEDIITRLDAPFYYVPGNHDVRRGGDKGPETPISVYTRRHGAVGKTYYSFDYKDCHFLVLNTPTAEVNPAFAAEQRKFIEKDLAGAKSAQHVFVFTHYPLNKNETVWPSLKKMLPRGRSTIFTGHYHAAGYAELDGIPAYVLASTGAGAENTPGSEHMFAHVSVDRGTPTISLVPVGQIKPSTYAAAAMTMRDIMSKAPAPGVNIEGGAVAFRPTNNSKQPITINYQFEAPDWEVTPASARITIQPGQTAEALFALKSHGMNPATPTLLQQYELGGYSASQKSNLPVSQTATLGQLTQVNLDGQASEWTNIPALEMSTRRYVVGGQEIWRGAMDSSARIRAAIAGDRLAMFIEVADDQINTDQKEPWNNDAVEICWDIRPAGMPNTGMTAGTGQMAVVPADAAGPAKQVAFIPAGQYGKPVPASLQSVTRRTTDGYVIELSIPLAELGTVPPMGLKQVNLAVNVDDRDLQGASAVTKRLSLTGTPDFWKSPAGYARFVAKP